MCGRYSLATPASNDLRARFALGESLEIRQRFNIAPGDDVVAVTTSKEGEPRGSLLRWGLVPFWAKEPKVGYKMINARAETVAEKPAFRDALKTRRCLIVADGFYEWQPRSGSPPQAAVPHHPIRRRAVRVRRALGHLARRRRRDAAHVHDHHHRGQRSPARHPRPDAGDAARPGGRRGVAGPRHARTAASGAADPAAGRPDRTARRRPGGQRRAPRRARLPRRRPTAETTAGRTRVCSEPSGVG